MSTDTLAFACTSIPFPDLPTPMPQAGAEEGSERPESQIARAIDAAMAGFLSDNESRAIEFFQEAIRLNPANDGLTCRLAIYSR